MTLPAKTDVAASPQQLYLLQSQLTRTEHFLSSTLSSSPLLRVSLRRVSFLFALVSPIAAAIDGHIDQLVHSCFPTHLLPASKLPPHGSDAADTTDKQQDADLLPSLLPAHPPSSPPDADGERMLVGAVWERHITDELSLSDVTPDQCLQAFYNASCHCFLALSASTPLTSSASPHRSALTFVSRLRSSLRSAWHADLLPAALSFYQLASHHLQHHSLLFPSPSPFPFFLSDSFREHFFALHAASVRFVYEQQLSAVCPAVYHSLERMSASPSSSDSLHSLHQHLSASSSLSPLIPHLSHALHRIHHHRTSDHLATTTQPSTAVVPFTPPAAIHSLTLSAALWSTVDTALVRWRHAVQRGCLALHECIRVMEEENERREMRDHEEENCLELEHDDMLMIMHDESDDDEDKQLMVLPQTAVSDTAIHATHSPNKSSMSQQLQHQILSSLKQLTAAPLTNPRTKSIPSSSSFPPLSPSSPALHYHLSHLYTTLATLHTHLVHYLLSSPLLHYPLDLVAALRESVLCVVGSEKERMGELEYNGLVGKLYEVLRALYETVVAVQCAE